MFEQYAASLPFDLGYQDFPAELAGLPAPYVAPEGALLLARCGRTVIGIVGLRRLRAGIAEIKRLYVVPGARGSGAGRALLEDIIDAAQRLGYLQVRRDSHRASMTTAIALYRRLGFAEIPPYGPDLGGQIAFFEKALRAGPADQEGTMAESITLPRQ